MEFIDRVLKCSDCNNDFIFTAGEQLFFSDRQFKNDPKRCKLCKARRAGLGRAAEGTTAALPLSRTETRTECSACGVQTTVPFKPTQGRPVFCRSCFQLRRLPAAAAGLSSPARSAEDAASAVLDAELRAEHAPSPDLSPQSTLEAIANTPAAAFATEKPSDLLTEEPLTV